MNGLLEKLRRGAIRALGGYVEQVPPPKPQSNVLIKAETRCVRQFVEQMTLPDYELYKEERREKYVNCGSEQLAGMLARRMLENGAIVIRKRSAPKGLEGIELRAAVCVIMPEVQ